MIEQRDRMNAEAIPARHHRPRPWLALLRSTRITTGSIECARRSVHQLNVHVNNIEQVCMHNGAQTTAVQRRQTAP